MNNLAIIPARGGSKRIPRKNLKDFLGQPIIKYVIDTAQNSGLFSEIMISTDDQEIALFAEQLGAIVPFMRSEKNSTDYATLSEVILEVLSCYELRNNIFDNVCLILPTSPLVTSERLKQAYEKLIADTFSSIIPIVKYSHPIQRALSLSTSGIVKMIQDHNNASRTQDLETSFFDSGQFYWLKTKDYLQEKTILTNNTGAIELSELEAQDIDNPADWAQAEMKYLWMKNRSEKL